MKTALLFWALLLGGIPQEPVEKPLFAFGAVADCQYCDVEGKRRRYRLSPAKLARCVEDLNTRELEFVVHLGDFIDRDWKSFDVVVPIFDRIRTRRYHVLGNHDFSVADEHKPKVPARLGLESRYYAFAAKGYRFLVLDGNDVSLYAHPKGSPEHRAAEKLKRERYPRLPGWNGAVGSGQLGWIRSTLKRAASAGERAILFCHFPIHPKNSHNLWNAPEVKAAIEESPAVVAYINGHNHAGNYAADKGVHYLTLKGMVDTEETAYSVVTVYADRLEVKGHGREQDRVLKIPAPDAGR